MKKFIIYSILFHFLVFLATSFFEERVKWSKGKYLFAHIVTPDELEARGGLRMSSNPKDHGFLNTFSEVTSGSSPGAADQILASQKSFVERERVFTALQAPNNMINSPRGAATKPVMGDGTTICDNFKASIPVFLCNAKIYFGQM